METVKEITRYVKLLSAEQREELLEQLRLSQLMSEAKRLDNSTRVTRKRNGSKMLTMKEIVAIVNSVRAERRKKHVA